jgi:excisionase family DNA binding protein
MQTLVPTAEAAKMVGISQRTLQRWIHRRKVKAPETILRNGRAVRLWSAREIKDLKDMKGQIYRRGRGRKKSGNHD